MSKYLYALAIRADKRGVSGISIQRIAAAATRAHSGNEALGIGVQMAQSEWPLEDGWCNHNAAYCEIAWKTCAWKYDDYSDHWDTACGEALMLLDGTPSDNKMWFCPYCGGRLTVAEPDAMESDA